MDIENNKYDFPSVSMKIIMSSGNARTIVNEALEALLTYDLVTAKRRLEEAKDCVKEAHRAQTKVMQTLAMDEFNGEEKTILPMLFVHAQDTIMTIMSEVNIFEQMLKIYEKLEKEIELCKK